MKVSMEWLEASGARFSAGQGRPGVAHLSHYSAATCEWGEGPPLVLIPGLAGGYELLGPMARLLARHHRVISYQLRGEDDCFSLRRRFGLSDLVQDLGEILDHFSLETPAVMGVSFGGVLALEYATRRPAGLSALLLQGTGAYFERGLLQRVAGMVLSRYPLPSDNPVVNQYFNLLFGRRQRPGPLFRFVTRQCWSTDQGVMAHRFRLVKRYQGGNRLDQVRVPTLVLTGERDLLVSKASLATLCHGIQECHAVQLEGCGHLAFVTQPERVANEVRAFLDSQRG